MERKEYLGRIKVYAIAKAAGNLSDLERVKVVWRKRKDDSPIQCYPSKYQLSYNPDGTPHHTAVLVDCAANCLYEVSLGEVEECGG